MDGDVLLLDEELDEEPLETGVDVPVELAQVVAQGIVAVVGELDRDAALGAAADPLETTADRALRHQQEALELAQKALVEDGRVDRRRQQGGPAAGSGRRPGRRLLGGRGRVAWRERRPHALRAHGAPPGSPVAPGSPRIPTRRTPRSTDRSARVPRGCPRLRVGPAVAAAERGPAAGEPGSAAVTRAADGPPATHRAPCPAHGNP